MKIYTEQELIQGCCENSRHFQEAMYKRYFATMMAMCLRHANNDKDAAMDMLNNGFLRVFQKIASFEARGSFEGWIRRIVYHAVVDYYKQHSKHSHFLIFEEKDEKVSETALQNCYVEDLLSLVNILPPMTQRVFKLYALEGFSHKEIGEQLDISDGTSKWHLSTAREKLKKLIENQYFQVKNA